MSAPCQRRRVAADTYPLFKHLKYAFVREASHLKRGHWTLNHLLDYTRLRDEFSDYPWLLPEWLDRLSLDLMDWHHPAHQPLFEHFRHRALHEHEDVYAPRPLFWGESQPEQQGVNAAPRIYDYGMHYRCNVALLDHEADTPRMVGNWVLSFAVEIPEARPAPALEMTLNSLYVLPEWQGYGVGSAVNRVVTELVCRVLSAPLAKALPDELPAPPAMQFDADYTSRNGQRMGRQIARRLAPLARHHGLLYYDSSRFCHQGTARNPV
ncbi:MULTISPECIES: hypothetical protein [Oceanimonas]|uniref:Uncharacterized protein n=1 Tax=Oceanimonas doudoroffii TaxID=84158 RepID=A0A233RD51_9GAMM|nr:MULTISPECIES: hypothetical protein [Oceanimonas]NHH99442.1 hypothetical protein [Oceanimonas sp. MB9]OXY81316.1 hypothetical protein B6S08_12545 [Oceanimonas doudoroffii]